MVFIEPTLIQNADDASSKNGVIINIDKIDDYLIFTHNGYHFTKQDFESIISAAKSTKTNKEKTGYKGIGFKSVFTNSQQVYVHSGGYHFLFNKNLELYNDFDGFYFKVNKKKTKEEQDDFLATFQSEKNTFRGVKDIPWQLLPVWYNHIPEILNKSIFGKNQKVSFALNIKNQKIEEYIRAIDLLFDNPKFILFLRHTNRLDIKFSNKTISKEIKDNIVTIKNSFASKRVEELIKKDFDNISVNNDSFANKGINIIIKEIVNKQGVSEKKFYDTSNQKLEDIPDRIASAHTTTISFVANFDNGIITKNSGNSLYAYLPMNEHRFRFPFFINADFVLTANRESLLNNSWNHYLLANIGELIVKWVAELAKSGIANCLDLLPNKYFDDNSLDIEYLAKSFNAAYKSSLETEAFILNHKGELAKQDEIIIDKTGLSEIVGADIFCQLLGTEKCLPSEKTDSKILEVDIFEYIEAMKFDDVIKAITDNSDFNDWYISTSDEKKTALYKWIEVKNIKTREDSLKSFVSNLPLFQFGEYYKSCKEIDYSEHIITTEHISPIRDVISKLGFICSDNVFNDSHPLFEYIDLPDEEYLFKSIKESDFSDLSTDERKTLFFALADFDGVGDAKLKGIFLFKNMNDEFKPLGEMVAYREDVPLWLKDYVLCKEDNSADLADYLIAQKDEFESIIRKNINNIATSWAELYQTYKEEWTGQFTRNIIDKYEIDNDLLTIIDESDTKTKEYFLNSIKKLDLHATSTYKKDSYEYRILKLALSVYEEPSDFSSKIYFDGQCIKDFSISDDVICEYNQNREAKKLKMSLAKLLPQYQNQSDSIEKIKGLFESKKDLDKFFAAKPKSIYDVHRELNQLLGIPESYFSEWNVDGNAQQYLFATYYRRHKKRWYNSYVPKIDLNNETDEFVYELLEFLFNNSVSIEESPFTYHLKKYFVDKYFESDFIFEDEQILPIIEQWADEDRKKKYLIQNGVKTPESNIIKFRQLFLENKSIDFINEMNEADIKSSINFIANTNQYIKPFIGDNQKDLLLSLKNKYKLFNDDHDIERINQNAIEWDSKEYVRWIATHATHIFIYTGILPFILSYNGIKLTFYTNNRIKYIYDKKQGRLYVSNTQKIEDIIFEIVKEGKLGITLEDYKQLCLDGKVTISQEELNQKDEEIERLKKELEEYKRIHGELKKNQPEKVPEKGDGGTITTGTTQGLPENEQWAAQLEAQKRLIQEFPQWKFPERYGDAKENSEPYYFSTAEVTNEDGNVVYIVLKSYKRRDVPFKINPKEWDYLLKNNAVLLIYIGDDIKRIYVKDLIMEQSYIRISFSTENISVEEKINAFADSLHYFKELHFDFDSFNISSKVQSAADLYKRNQMAFFSNDNTENDI